MRMLYMSIGTLPVWTYKAILYKGKFMAACTTIETNNIDSWPSQFGKPLHLLNK